VTLQELNRLVGFTARYREIVESSEALVTVCDHDGVLSFVNRRAAEHIGIDSSEAVGRSWLQLFVVPEQRDAFQGLCPTILAGEQVGARETDFLDAGGRRRRVRWVFTMLHGEAEPSLCALGVDVTEQREVAASAGRAERMASLGTLTAGLAHEIRNPLNSAHLQLTVAARRLGHQPPDVPAALEAVRLADSETRRLASLVAEFLDFARPEPLRLASTDLRAIAGEIVGVMLPEATGAGVALVLEPGAPMRARLDADRVKQALINLVRNGIQAAAANGEVSIALSSEEGHVVAKVSDDGPGFPADARPFEPFFTTKSDGTGLGLAIVHRVVSDHGGQVSLDRRAGRTIVTMRLPGLVPVHLPLAGGGGMAVQMADAPPSVVRQQVLAQHQVLRQMLRNTLDVSTEALRHQGPARQQMAAKVRELRERFHAHLSFEERWLAPVLGATDCWGPARVKNLLEEHERQRAELDTLLEGIDDWDPERLALAARSLVTDLLLDMEEEERGCLDAELLRDDVVNVDQATD